MNKAIFLNLGELVAVHAAICVRIEESIADTPDDLATMVCAHHKLSAAINEKPEYFWKDSAVLYRDGSLCSTPGARHQDYYAGDPPQVIYPDVISMLPPADGVQHG